MKDFRPFSLKSRNILQFWQRDRYGVIKRNMRSEEVVMSNNQSGKSNSTVGSFEVVSSSDMGFVGSIKTLNKLLKRSEFFRFSIKVLKSNDFFKREFRIKRLIKEVNTGLIRRIAVSNESNFLSRFRCANRLVCL